MEENNSLLNTKSNAWGFGIFFSGGVALMIWIAAAAYGLKTGEHTAREEVEKEISPYIQKTTGMKFTEWLQLQRSQEKLEKAQKELDGLKFKELTR